MLPKISVITPSYNQGQFIRQTVESVLSQEYPNLEYIVVDGLSTDNTLDVLASYSVDQLKLITEKDRGQTDAINKGIRLATGDILCWLNSDDIFLPGALQTVGQYFAQHPDSCWLTGDCQIINEVGKPIQGPIQLYKRLLRSLVPAFYLGLTNAICQPSTFWLRSAHQTLGMLDEQLHYTMDYDWWLRLNKLHSPAILTQPLAAFRIHSQSKGGSLYGKQFAEDYATLCRYNTSVPLQHLHALHNQLTVSAYRLLK
ncbi:glycosyltransferase family 2 protein [Spirosoma flavum]|uniref:Glycosyltransferase family 2 protein n=1 Tax=Spirosoma flavum TaxID=2048557 RepID=A0ABW6AVS8_9BACT